MKTILYDPEIVFQKFLEHFKRDRLIAFKSAIIAGLLTHLVLMILQPVVADPVIYMNWVKAGEYELYSQGHWSWNLLMMLRGYIVQPILSTIITIFSTALMAVIIIELFDIKGKLAIIIAASSIAVHPHIANTLMYYYSAGTIGNFLVVLSIWIIYKFQSSAFTKILLSTFFLTIMLAFYQPYISTATLLSLLLLILDLLHCKKKKSTWSHFFQCICVCGISSVLYLIIWKILCHFNNIYSFYGGASSYGLGNTLKRLPSIIFHIYSNFFDYFFTDSILHNSYWYRDVCNLILFIGLISIFIILIKNNVQEGKYNKFDIITLIFCVLLIPIAALSICLIVTDYNYYLMMAQSFLLFVPLFCKLSEMGSACTKHFSQNMLLKWGIILCCIYTTWTFALSDIAGYMLLLNSLQRNARFVLNSLQRNARFG